jgi:hypothetical protein
MQNTQNKIIELLNGSHLLRTMPPFCEEPTSASPGLALPLWPDSLAIKGPGTRYGSPHGFVIFTAFVMAVVFAN